MKNFFMVFKFILLFNSLYLLVKFLGVMKVEEINLFNSLLVLTDEKIINLMFILISSYIVYAIYSLYYYNKDLTFVNTTLFYCLVNFYLICDNHLKFKFIKIIKYCTESEKISIFKEIYYTKIESLCKLNNIQFDKDIVDNQLDSLIAKFHKDDFFLKNHFKIIENQADISSKEDFNLLFISTNNKNSKFEFINYYCDLVVNFSEQHPVIFYGSLILISSATVYYFFFYNNNLLPKNTKDFSSQTDNDLSLKEDNLLKENTQLLNSNKILQHTNNELNETVDNFLKDNNKMMFQNSDLSEANENLLKENTQLSNSNKMLEDINLNLKETVNNVSKDNNRIMVQNSDLSEAKVNLENEVVRLKSFSEEAFDKFFTTQQQLKDAKEYFISSPVDNFGKLSSVLHRFISKREAPSAIITEVFRLIKETTQSAEYKTLILEAVAAFSDSFSSLLTKKDLNEQQITAHSKKAADQLLLIFTAMWNELHTWFSKNKK